MKISVIAFVVSMAIGAACESTQDSKQRTLLPMGNANPPAPGFNLEESDELAMEIADQVMLAMGGRRAWDNTHYLEWNFFGARKLLWDKYTGLVKINYLNEDQAAVVNIYTREGEVMKDGKMLTNPDSLNKYLDRAYKVWVNDAYWLVMPFKLKDTGVTLKYLGEDTIQTGDPAHKLQLTFEEVGVTPQNKYHVWVDQSKDLVTQWAYFREYTQEESNFITPWRGYEKYGEILLASDRGDRDITEIAVYDKVENGTFKLE